MTKSICNLDKLIFIKTILLISAAFLIIYLLNYASSSKLIKEALTSQPNLAGAWHGCVKGVEVGEVLPALVGALAWLHSYPGPVVGLVLVLDEVLVCTRNLRRESGSKL